MTVYTAYPLGQGKANKENHINEKSFEFNFVRQPYRKLFNLLKGVVTERWGIVLHILKRPHPRHCRQIPRKNWTPAHFTKFKWPKRFYTPWPLTKEFEFDTEIMHEEILYSIGWKVQAEKTQIFVLIFSNAFSWDNSGSLWSLSISVHFTLNHELV